MAQWDQRDPRWLVKELGTSGSNVNGWHWEETSKISWARTRLSSLLKDLEASLSPEKGEAAITGTKDVKGEEKCPKALLTEKVLQAYLSRRKGNKMLVIYDLEITLDWRGKLTGEDQDVIGTVKITEFSLGNDEDDYVISVSSEKEDAKYSCLVEAVKALQPDLVKLLLQFDQEIRELQQ